MINISQTYGVMATKNTTFIKKEKEKKKKKVVLKLILRKFQQQIKVSIIINLGSCEIMIIQDLRIQMMVVYNLQSTLNMKYVLRLSFR